MSEHEDEPEDSPVPDISNPPVPPDSPIVSPVPEIVSSLTEAFKPTFKQIEESYNKLERRAVDQQKQIEDMKVEMNKAIEDKIIQVMKAVTPAAPSTVQYQDQYMNPAQTAQMAPAGAGGIKGFIGQLMQFVMSPDGRSLLGQFTGQTNPGLITIDTNAIFEGGIQKAVRDVATKSLRVAFGGLEDRVSPMGYSALDHVVVPDHVP